MSEEYQQTQQQDFQETYQETHQATQKHSDTATIVEPNPTGTKAYTPPSIQSMTIGRYEISEKIGSGAFGTVYKAFDPLLNRTVAVKVPSFNIAEEDLKILVKNFYNEAKLAAKFLHTNIVAIYDVGSKNISTDTESEHNIHYLVMENVNGTDLKGYLKDSNGLPLDMTFEIIFNCCKALDYIHFHGIIHRDIKPGNILFNPAYGVVKLMDFGIAHSISEQTNKLQGSPLYMAPENFDDNLVISEKTDLFALAGVLYELLTGKPPFQASSRDALEYQIKNIDPTPISEIRTDINKEIDDVMAIALHKNPYQRFPNALAFAEALRDVLGHSNATDSLGDMDDTLVHGMDQYLDLRHELWFKDFPPEQINDLLRAGQVVSFEPDQVMIKEGDSGTEFYTLLSGYAVVSKEDQIISMLEPGESFGELGHSSKSHIRTATVIAKENVKVLKIMSEKLEHVSDATKANLYKAFLDITTKRLQQRTIEISEMKSQDDN